MLASSAPKKGGRSQTLVIKTFTLAEVAAKLKIHRETAATYQKIAKLYLRDYRALYTPRAPLDPYQAWVLDQIAQTMRQCQSYTILKRHLFANRHKYTLENFRRIQDATIKFS
jgi:hypothetical protein